MTITITSSVTITIIITITTMTITITVTITRIISKFYHPPGAHLLHEFDMGFETSSTLCGDLNIL